MNTYYNNIYLLFFAGSVLLILFGVKTPKMRKKYFALSLIFCGFIVSNANAQSHSKDSSALYRKKFWEYRKSVFDSMENSATYQSLKSKAFPSNSRANDVGIELLVCLGWQRHNFNNINNDLKAIGAREIKPETMSLGIEFAVRYPIMTYGFELGNFLRGGSPMYQGGYGKFFIGTHIFKKKKLCLFPHIGYGSGTTSIYINKPYTATTLGGLFSTQSNAVNLKHSMEFIDFALGFKLKGKSENLYWQFIKAGYRLDISNNKWTTYEGDFIGAPNEKSSQFYIQLNIGIDQ